METRFEIVMVKRSLSAANIISDGKTISITSWSMGRALKCRTPDASPYRAIFTKRLIARPKRKRPRMHEAVFATRRRLWLS